MPEHLIERQLQGYRDRTLALGEMMAVDAHLGGCQSCRTALSGLADKTATASVMAGIDQARFRHLSYEQMDDWVEDRLDPAGRELVMAHIGTCSPCARQLIAYQEYAPAMAAPIQTMRVAAAVPQKASFWSFLKQPQYALGAAAVVAFFIVTPLTRHSSPEPVGAILAPTNTAVDSTIPEKNIPLLNEAVNVSELDSLPDSLRAGVKQFINAPESAVRPAALKGLESSGGGMLESPVSEVVETTLPELRWKAFGDSYSVSLYDSRHVLISRRGELKETRWTPPSALSRDKVYTWEVEAGAQKYHGSFKVLGEAQLSELQKIRAEHGSSHLVMGAVSEELGLLTAARAEFEAMGNEQGRKLASSVDGLRK
jgi:hypothetical protein